MQLPCLYSHFYFLQLTYVTNTVELPQNKQEIYLFTLAHYKETSDKQNKNYSHIGNFEEEELPKKSVGRLLANKHPTVGQQTAESLSTVGQQGFWGALLQNYQGK